MDVLARLALAQAARLARRGQYRPAEALLVEAALAAPGPRADILDLRARMHAQQGRRSEAEALWREALSLDPGNADIQAALATLARPSGGRARLVGVAARSLGVVAVLLLAWTVLAQRRELVRIGTEPSAPAAAPVEAQGAADDAVTVLDSVAAALAPLGELDIVRGDRDLEVRFREGLFTEGDALRVGAHARIASIARSLAPLQSRLGVLVVGHTDPIPLRAGSAYPSNLALGLARATRVAGIFLDSGALPAERVTAQSLGDASPPYPADTPEQGERNRTVTLRFAPAR